MDIFETHQPITEDVMRQVTALLTALPEQQRTTVMEIHVEIRTNIGYQVSIISLPDGQRHRTEIEIPAGNTPDAAANGEHVVTLTPDGKYDRLRWAVCTCGWRSAGASKPFVAQQFANEHAAANLFPAS